MLKRTIALSAASTAWLVLSVLPGLAARPTTNPGLSHQPTTEATAGSGHQSNVATQHQGGASATHRSTMAACVKAVNKQRNADLKTARQTYTATLKAGADTHRTAVQAADALTHATAKDAAMKAAQDAFKAARTTTRTAFTTARKTAQTAYKTALAACRSAQQAQRTFPQPASSAAKGQNVVVYTDSGFSPSTLMVKKGDTVIFKNTASDAMRVAANPHPLHNGYPTTGGCVSSTFDSCQDIAPVSSWSFEFDIVGTWGYHNHLNPGEGGTIVVQ